MVFWFLSTPLDICNGKIAHSELHRADYTISQYDDLFKSIATTNNLDWHFLSAIAYIESRFDCNLISDHGAIGLMQIRPVTAKHFNIPIESIHDPAVNILVSAKLIREIETIFHLNNMPDTSKYKIIMAGYNSGIGNLKEARQMAKADSLDYNNWETLKNYGKFKNNETPRFVRDVIKKWVEYSNLTANNHNSTF